MEWLQLVFVFLVGVITLLIYSMIKPKNFPPGPIGLPILGYLPFLKKTLHESLRDIGQGYGSVFSLPLGHKFIIVLNDWKAIKEALVVQTENFCGRPYTIIFNEVRKRTGKILIGLFWYLNSS